MQDTEVFPNPLFLRLAAIFAETSSSRYREMNTFSAGKLWIVPFYDIFSNVFLNFIAVVGVVAQCVKYLGKCKMRKVFHNFFGRCPKLPPFNNGAYGSSCAFNNRLSSEDFIVTNNVRMLCGYYHNDSILPYFLIKLTNV